MPDHNTCEPVTYEPPARLSIWQAVKQSWLIHPDWTPDIHLDWLSWEGYHVGVFSSGTPEKVITRWLNDHRRAAGEALAPA